MKNITILKRKTVDGIEIAMLKDEDASNFPWIIAWKFDEKEMGWGQGHYFSTEIDALIKYGEYK